MTKEMKRPTSHISGNSIKPALSKAVEFYTDNNRQAYECIHERDEYIDYLESKLSNARPHQALPVVPEFVAEWYEEEKDSLEFAVYDINTSIHRKSLNDRTKIEKWFARADNKPIETVFKMKDGYTVKKPQLFRVCLLDGRHTLTRRDPRKTLPFNYTFLWSYSSELKEMREINRKVDLFTEQEIKSIDERYWQFAMPVEDGE